MTKFKNNPVSTSGLFWYSIVAMACIVYLLSSCNTNRQIGKKIEEGYEVVGMFPPKTKKDSGNFYIRADDMIKRKDSIVVKSRVIKVPYSVEKLQNVLDTATRRKLIDSLAKVQKQYDDYNQEDCDRQVAEALDAGYRQGQYEAWVNGRDSLTPEIHYFPDPSIIEKVDAANFRLRNAQDQIIALTARNEMLKSSGTKKNWTMGVLIFLLGGVAFFKIKSLAKPKTVTDVLKNI